MVTPVLRFRAVVLDMGKTRVIERTAQRTGRHWLTCSILVALFRVMASSFMLGRAYITQAMQASRLWTYLSRPHHGKWRSKAGERRWPREIITTTPLHEQRAPGRAEDSMTSA
jgi:hypothetical protein